MVRKGIPSSRRGKQEIGSGLVDGSLLEEEGSGISAFLDGLEDKLVSVSADAAARSTGAVRITDRGDPELAYFKKFAPNAIEWLVGSQYLGLQTAYRHTRQYEIVRDFFQLRCPLPSCNAQDEESRTAWGKGREYLESENLLTWSSRHQEEVCPSCGTTRSEFLADGLLDWYSSLHVIAGMRCLPGDALVKTSRGLRKLQSFLPPNPAPDTFYPLEGVKVLGVNGWEAASDAYYAGTAPTKVLKLAAGRRLTGSHIHPVYGYSGGRWGWHQLKDIRPGDYVEGRVSSDWRGSPEFPHRVSEAIRELATAHRGNSIEVPTRWSDDLGAILGYLVAEGSIAHATHVRFTNGDADIRAHFGTLMRSEFGLETLDTRRPDGEILEVSTSSRTMRRVLAELGLGYVGAHDKSVPEALWSAPESVACAFLRAYFEGGGTAAVERGGGRKPVVVCYTVSPRLANDIQEMLWNLGIAASMSTTKSGEFGTGGRKFDHDAYSVRIHGRDIVRFAQKIGFNSARKREALEACVERTQQTKTRDDGVPHVRELLLQLRGRTSWSGKSFARTANHRSGRSKSLAKSVLRHVLDSVSRDEAPEVWDQLNRLVHSESRWLRVEAVEDGPEQPLYDLHVPGTNSFVAGSFMNHNSGKSVTASLIGTYIEHVITVLAHSQPNGLGAYFGQLPTQHFEVVFVASTDTQAAETVWAYYTNFRQAAPWIQRYVAWITKQQETQAAKTGARRWSYKELDKEIENGLIRVTYRSANSNSGGLAGRTRLAAFADEMARFDMGESRRSAGEVYRVLENSLQTVRSDVGLRIHELKERRLAGDTTPPDRPFFPWLAPMISITSPISANDEAMRLYEASRNLKNMYARKYATWEFNPDQPRHLFDEVFIKDPIRARRDFGADPPKAASPLIQDPITFARRALDHELRPTVHFVNTTHVGKLGDEYVSIRCREPPDLDPGPQRYMCFDAGQNFDQFAGACAHGEWRETSDGKQFVTVYDWVFRILPQDAPRRDVWFDAVVDVVKLIATRHTIAEVHFDRWQSTYLIQRLRDSGINASVSRTTVNDFSKLVGDVMAGKVAMVAPPDQDQFEEPPNKTAYGLAIYELERLEFDGRKVFNPSKGQRRGYDSDDVAQVVAHVNRMVQDSVVDISDRNSIKDQRRRSMVGSIAWGARGSIVPGGTRRGW